MLVQEGNWTCSIFFHLCMVLVILGLEWARGGVLHPGCHLSWMRLFILKSCMDFPLLKGNKFEIQYPGRLFNDADHLRPLPSQLRWVWPWAKGGGTLGLLFVRVQSFVPHVWLFTNFPTGDSTRRWQNRGCLMAHRNRWFRHTSTGQNAVQMQMPEMALHSSNDQIWSHYLWSKLWNLSEL